MEPGPAPRHGAAVPDPSPAAAPFAAGPPTTPADSGGPAARALLALGGAGVAAWVVLGFAQRGELGPGSLSALAAGLVFAAALVGVGLRPAAAARFLDAPGLVTPGGLGAFALVAFALYVLFGLGVLVETVRLLEAVAAGASPGEVVSAINRAELLLSLGINFLVFTLPVVAWASAAQRERGAAMWAWLWLGTGDAKWSLAWSGASIILVFWFLIAAGLGGRALGFGEVENPRAEAIARSLDPFLALLVALMTGIGEELFFRGFLLRKIGNAPQSVLFGLAHLNYLQWLEVAVTGALGYMFGRAVLRTGSLVGPIVGHAAFNFVSLLIVMYRDTLPV